MLLYRNLTLLFSLGICIFGFSNVVSQDSPTEKTPPLIDDNIIGYKYNLWAMQATSLINEDTYRFTGRIFLDKRKSYKATFDKKEHTFMYKYEFQNGGIHYFRGNDSFSKVVKHLDIKNYYIALKFDRDWVHHTYDDIIKNQNFKIKNEVGCKTCNFSTEIYNKDKSWKFTLSYEIRPIYKNEDSSVAQAELIERSDNHITFLEAGIQNETKEVKNNSQNKNAIVNSNSISYHVLFKVLKIPNKEFVELKNIGPIYEETFDDKGTTRYLIGNETSYKEIIKVAKQIEELGFKECKIAKYKNGALKSYLDLK